MLLCQVKCKQAVNLSSSRIYIISYETGLSKNRIEALTDGVFAVVTTLLVLDISIPQISSNHAAAGDAAVIEAELLKRLFDLWPKILCFGISFIVLAICWMAHHGQFHYINGPGSYPCLDKYYIFNGNMSFTFFYVFVSRVQRATNLDFCIWR